MIRPKSVGQKKKDCGGKAFCILSCSNPRGTADPEGGVLMHEKSQRVNEGLTKTDIQMRRAPEKRKSQGRDRTKGRGGELSQSGRRKSGAQCPA